jgi:hypothetical protein
MVEEMAASDKIKSLVQHGSAKGVGAERIKFAVSCELIPEERQIPVPVFESKYLSLQFSPPRPIQDSHGKVAGAAGNIEHAKLSEAVARYLPCQGVQEKSSSAKNSIDPPEVQKRIPHLLVRQLSSV